MQSIKLISQISSHNSFTSIERLSANDADAFIDNQTVKTSLHITRLVWIVFHLFKGES